MHELPPRDAVCQKIVPGLWDCPAPEATVGEAAGKIRWAEGGVAEEVKKTHNASAMLDEALIMVCTINHYHQGRVNLFACSINCHYVIYF